MSAHAALQEAIKAAGPRVVPGRPLVARVQRSDYEPWWAQRQFHRPRTINRCPKTGRYVLGWPRFRVVVAARQTGKTRAGAEEIIQTMAGEPGSYSVLLAPTYQIARAAIDHVCTRVAELGLGWQWREQKKMLEAPNGSKWVVFSADRKETVRGPTITGILWVDEAAFLNEAAYNAALGAITGNFTSRVVITTTPKGMNWVYREWTLHDLENTRKLRFRSSDSPYTDQALVQRLRRSMSEEMYRQEFEAEFVESLLLPFPPEIRERMWVDSLPKREAKDVENFLGVDLGREQDWCVLTLCNRHGEARIVSRWQRETWPETMRRILSAAKAHNAVTVIDTGGPGGGSGGVLADFLELEHKLTVLRVATNQRGTKGQMVEQLRADAQWDNFKLLRNEHYEQADHELGVFQGRKTTYQGQEIHVFEGPQMPGEHDDCVISLCLANWGRRVTEVVPDPLAGDFANFIRQGAALAPEQKTNTPRRPEGPGWGESLSQYTL